MTDIRDGSPRRHFEGIESLRAFAAVSIILFHLAAMVGDKFPPGFDFIRTRFGMGVPLFFVISGFSLSYGYFGRLDSVRNIEQYFVRRFARIAPLFYAMLVFQLFYLYFRSGVTFAASDILANVLFIFNFVPHMADGVVPASWSIGIEMVFYVVFPLVILLCTSIRRSVATLAISIFVATKFTADMNHATGISQSFNYHNVVANVPFFMWGVLAYHVHQRMIPRLTAAGRVRIFGLVLNLMAVGVLVLLYEFPSLLELSIRYDISRTWSAMWGFPFFLLCLGAAVWPTVLISNAVTRYVGKISFSVYLLHPNIVWDLGQGGFYAWVDSLMPTHHAWSYLLVSITAVCIVVALASVTYRFIERPGMNFRKTTSRPTWFR